MRRCRAKASNLFGCSPAIARGRESSYRRTMPPRADAQIPLEALRDLVGVCRALYAAWKSSGMGPVELEELAGIGRDLCAALELAQKTRPDTVGHRAAWSRAELATQRLGHLVSLLEPLRPTIAAASQRVCGGDTESSLDRREAKKKHRRMRS